MEKSKRSWAEKQLTMSMTGDNIVHDAIERHVRLQDRQKSRMVVDWARFETAVGCLLHEV